MKNRIKKKHLWLLAIPILTALALWLIWGNTALEATEVQIMSKRLPDSFNGFRVALLSDLHNAEFGEKNEKLLRLLSDCSPDLIALTGDLVDSSRTDIGIALDFAREAASLAPTYYVTGNHEAVIEDFDQLMTGLDNAGVHVLRDQSVRLEKGTDSLMLIGLDDPYFQLQGDLFGEAAAMARTKLKGLIGDADTFTLLLSHRPELFETYVECGIDLALCGHAHGGQFRLPLIGGLIAPNQGLFPKYDAGLFTAGNTHMVVSRGLGNSIIPLRINDRPEIVVVTLRKPSNFNGEKTD